MNRRQFLGRALLAWSGARLLHPAVSGAVEAARRGRRSAGRMPAHGASPPSAPAAGTPGAASRAAVQARCRDGLEVARKHILENCTDLAFPNGAIHGVRALGRDCPLGQGDPFRILMENYLEESAVGDRTFLEVSVAREGHRNAMLKTLLEKGCEPELEFQLHGRTYHFRDYIESARQLATYDLRSVPIDEHSWTIIALTRVIRPSAARWTNAFGHEVDLQRMIDDTSEALASDTELVRRVDLASRQPLPRDCPALGRACGGLHMLYALAAALSSGYATPARRQAFAAHMRTHVRRLVYDMRVTDDVEAENLKLAGKEAAQVVAFDSRLKFLGHTFEVIGLVDRHDLYAFTPEERRRVDAARDTLCGVLAGSRGMRFARYKPDLALYDSMAGDVCHAYNGLMMSPA